jgi:4-oxalomesaconate tautomerase
VLPGSVAHQVAVVPAKTEGSIDVEVEHPTGFFTVTIEVRLDDGVPVVTRSALLRTARLLMRGEVMVPASVWDGESPR